VKESREISRLVKVLTTVPEVKLVIFSLVPKVFDDAGQVDTGKAIGLRIELEHAIGEVQEYSNNNRRLTQRLKDMKL
jgi:hypothetical protein